MVNKFTIGLEDLKRSVLYNRSVTSSKGLDDNTKNIIFVAKEGSLEVSSHATGTDGTLVLDPQEISVDGTWDFQLRSSSISKLIGSYANLTHTKVSGITFTEAKDAVLIDVHETVKSEDDDPRLAQDGHYRIGVVPLEARVREAVSKEFPTEDVTKVPAAAVDLYIRDLLRLVNNNKSAGSESMIYLSPDYAFVHSSTSYSAFLHTLPEEFHDISLNYSQALSLLVLNDEATGNALSADETDDEELQSLAEDDEDDDVLFADEEEEDDLEDTQAATPEVEVARVSANVLAFRYKSARLFLTVRGLKVRYKDYFDPAFERDDEGEYVNRNLLFSVNRSYIKSVLKRVAFDGEDVNFTIEDGFLEASAKSFSQNVPIVDSKGAIEDIKFKVSPSILEKMIIGNDKEFSQLEDGEEVIFLFTLTKRGYFLQLTDALSVWISTANVRKS